MHIQLLIKRVFHRRGSSKLEEACDIYVRAANMFKMAKNWCGKKNWITVWVNGCIYSSNLFPNELLLTWNFIFSAAGNAFSQAARLHLQMQSKHDAATNFIDAGNAFKKADPQGNNDSLNTFSPFLMICNLIKIYKVMSMNKNPAV